MKKKIFNLLKLFVLVLTLFVSFTGMKLNVFAAPDGFVPDPSPNLPPIDDEDTSLNHEPVLVSLKGATVSVPSDWSASAGYGDFNVHCYITFNDTQYYSQCIHIGYRMNTDGSDTSENDRISFDSDELLPFEYSCISPQASIVFVFIGGNQLNNPDLIQWFVDNDAIITGGVYSDDVVSVTNDIGDTKLVWELNWLETTEETVSDYVEIYPSSDTKQCYIVFKKSFSIPMELVVKSEDDESIYASCDVDCYERTETVGSASLSVSLDGSTNSDLLLGQDGEEDEITFNGNTSYESIFTDQKIEINSMSATTSKVGTLSTTQEVSYNVGLSEELQTLLEDREITFVSATSNLISSTVKGLLESLITFTDDNKETVYEALNTCDNWFRVDVEVIDKYHDEIINEYLYTIDIIGFVINDYYETPSVPTDLTGYTVNVPSGWTCFEDWCGFGITGSITFNNKTYCFYDYDNLTGKRNFFIGFKNYPDEFTDNYICFLTTESSSYLSLTNSSFIIVIEKINVTVNPQSDLINWLVSVNATFTKN